GIAPIGEQGSHIVWRGGRPTARRHGRRQVHIAQQAFEMVNDEPYTMPRAGAFDGVQKLGAQQ
ncbi:MAG TPA: hypothetical protein VFH51_14850, partial [Myxococcota bacterium]|nr:hypothetical protein [Myxococcota bacterium]